MKVGEEVRVYRKVKNTTEKCSFGLVHRVPVYEVKFLTITHITQEFIKFLYYDADGYGAVYYAIDHQGRQYRKEPHWDGPRATRWVRASDLNTYDQYPSKTFSRDLTGRGFIP